MTTSGAIGVFSPYNPSTFCWLATCQGNQAETTKQQIGPYTGPTPIPILRTPIPTSWGSFWVSPFSGGAPVAGIPRCSLTGCPSPNKTRDTWSTWMHLEPRASSAPAGPAGCVADSGALASRRIDSATSRNANRSLSPRSPGDKG